MEPIVSELLEFAKIHNLSRQALAAKTGIPVKTMEDWLYRAAKPSHASRHKISSFLLAEEARRRTSKVKWLLLLLEDELSWFRLGPVEARDAFRKELDTYDVGYISSLLTMIGDEERFQRWLLLSTNEFHAFQGEDKHG